MSKKMKLLALLLGVMVMMLGLSGCRYLGERKFADLEKVYPTQNAYDLFKVFPKGFHILNVASYNSTSYYLDLEGDYANKLITGTLEVNENDQMVKRVDVELKESGEFIVHQQLEEKYQDYLEQFQFLFQLLNLSQDQLHSLKSKKTWDNANGDYIRFYEMDNKIVANYLKIKGTNFGINIQGNLEEDKRFGYSREVEIGRDDSSISESIFSRGEK
ncbi:hypothetical protein [Streptococcus oricebi]|uniref:Lipoprotein n=1 Tax=Streptococcus oricebi TaxID=1547447 RepID=A0ABS5B2K5_9STRE|nr:hypothetical protein [Streptococcus oricebi]MBP2622736.1 hypothetical protein [Streptococcus oricebi]